MSKKESSSDDSDSSDEEETKPAVAKKAAVPAKPTATIKTLEDFIKKQIVEKERQLECPVCLEVAAPPILMCSELHLICSDCRPRIKNCPVCRKDFQNDSKRHRFAEQMAQEIEDLRKELENARS